MKRYTTLVATDLGRGMYWFAAMADALGQSIKETHTTFRPPSHLYLLARWPDDIQALGTDTSVPSIIST